MFVLQLEWTVSDVIDFLETCRAKIGSKVDNYKQIVVENDVDGEVLADMTDEQLQRCPLSMCIPRPAKAPDSQAIAQAGNREFRPPALHSEEAAATEAGGQRPRRRSRGGHGSTSPQHP